VLFCSAANLKKSTLRLLKEIVTFTPSSFTTKCSGAGRKSAMTSAFTGSFVYLVFLLIYALAFPPIPGANYADHFAPISESHRENAFVNLTETIVTGLRFAVREVASDHAVRIQERLLGEGETDAMLTLIFRVLFGIPLEACSHDLV
jgi:hypothetical protein